MIKRGQQIGFALEVLHDGLPNERIWCSVDHLLDRNQFYNVGKMQIAGTVYGPHAADPNDILDQVAL